jgi:hypothetical protein
MIKRKKVVIALLIGLISNIILVDIIDAITMSVTVPAGEQEVRKIDLAVDDRVRVQFTVVGTKSNLISFSLVCPNGTEIDFGDIGRLNHSFICDAEGEYTMFFANSNPTDSKLVTLNYEIEHYLFGMPQTFFLVLVIVMFCLAMVAVYFLAYPSM